MMKSSFLNKLGGMKEKRGCYNISILGLDNSGKSAALLRLEGGEICRRR